MTSEQQCLCKAGTGSHYRRRSGNSSDQLDQCKVLWNWSMPFFTLCCRPGQCSECGTKHLEQNHLQPDLVEKNRPSAFLGPELKIWWENFILWYDSEYYLLLIFHVGNGEVATRSLRPIRRDFRTLGQHVKGSGAGAVFIILPVAGSDEEEWWGRTRKSVPSCEPGVTGRILGFLIMGWSPWHWACWQQMGYTCLKGEKDLCIAVSRAHWMSFKLDLKWEGDKTRLLRDKHGGGMPSFEGSCASEVHDVLITWSTFEMSL